jgi:hypothetical protein
MRRLSIRMSESMYKQLVEKGQQMGVDNVSNATRLLLLQALENEERNQNKWENNTLLYQTMNHTVMVHSLLEECLLSLVESGSELKDKAQEKAEKIVAQLMENSFE